MITRIRKLSVLFVAALVLTFASLAQAAPAWTSFDVTSSHGIEYTPGETVVQALHFGGVSNSPALEIGVGATIQVFTYDGAQPSPKSNGGGWGNGPAGFPGTTFRTFLNESTFNSATATINLGPTTAGHPYRLQLITYDGGSLGGNKVMSSLINDDGDTGFSANRVTANATLAKIFKAEWTSAGVANLTVTLDDPSENDWQIAGLLLTDLFQEPTGVPEPSTYALGLIGLAGLGLVAWRRRRCG